MSIKDALTNIIDDLSEHLDEADKIDTQAHGWKSANKRLRKATLEARESLKALKAQSMDLER
jgi:hypothetical protein